jgi:hypothetical protein
MMPDQPFTPAPATVERVKHLLSGAPPLGAFALGIACGTAWQSQHEPERRMLAAARCCVSVEEAFTLFTDPEGQMPKA